MSARSGARAAPRFLSQYAKNARLDGCFMTVRFTPGDIWRDKSVPLQRTRDPFLVVQEGICSVHAAEAFSHPLAQPLRH
jgi:hypothetical protein